MDTDVRGGITIFEEYVVDLNADCKCGCRDLSRFHNIYRFPNGLGASVVENPKRPGFSAGGYRALLIRFSDETTFSKANLGQFDSNPVECADWGAVLMVLEEVFGLEGRTL